MTKSSYHRQAAYYERNKALVAERRRKYREENKELMLEREQQTRQRNRATAAAYREENKVKQQEYRKEYNITNKESLNVKCRERGRRLKLDALTHYGPGKLLKCTHCNETNLTILQIDHINGGGKAHARSLNSSTIYYWLKTNNYPDGFQTLCANCNLIKEIEKCRANRKSTNNRQHAHYDQLKLDVFSAYSGGSPKCANESCLEHHNPRFDCLTLDHINGDGATHRKAGGGSGRKLYTELRRLDYPPGYQILCSNCNIAKGTSQTSDGLKCVRKNA